MSIEPGDRIRHASRLGTVRYVGPVAGAPRPASDSGDEEPVFVGIEWDEGDGRNDGVGPTGQRYFRCSRAGKTATFFPLGVVAPFFHSVGWSVQEALRAKYGLEQPVEQLEVGLGSGAKIVEFVERQHADGEPDVRRLHQADLSACPITSDRLIVHYRPRDELLADARLAELRELNVTGHLLPSWQALFSLAACFPHLEILCASRSFCPAVGAGYELPPPTSSSSSSSSSSMVAVEEATQAWPTCPSLRFLVLNDCRLTDWRLLDFLALSGGLPSVRELQLQKNDMTTCRPAAAWPNLTDLDLARNSLSDWSDVLTALAEQRWPALRRLVLSGNSFGDELIGQQQQQHCYGELEHLSLDHNRVGNWQTVAALAAVFPGLKSLRLMHNPLCDACGAVATRNLLVHLVPSLQRLNGSDVTTDERADSQRFFLQWFSTVKQLPATADRRQFGLAGASESFVERLAERFNQLLLELGCGDDVQPLGKAAEDNTLADDLVQIRVVSTNPNASTLAPLAVGVLSSMKVADLHQLCANHFNIAPHEQSLSFRYSRADLPQPLDDPSLPLFMYGITSRAPLEILLS